MGDDSRVELGIYRSYYDTELGSGGVVASAAGLLEVVTPFGGSSREKVAECIAARYPLAFTESPLTERAARLLTSYFAGEPVSFDLPIDFTGVTPFQKSVYDAVMALQYGVLESYGEIAARIGRSGAARGVGWAMARNPLPIVIPCHRVVGGGGKLTGYSAPGGVESKKRLLVMEGAVVEGTAKVKHGKTGG